MKKNLVLIVGIVALVVGLVGGYLIGKGSAPQSQFGQFGQNGQSRFPGGRANGITGQIGGFVSGQIINMDDRSITVQIRDGSSKIVFYSSSTEVMKSVQGSGNDFSSGGQVTVTGSANSDGSITAQSVQIRPAATSSAPKSN